MPYLFVSLIFGVVILICKIISFLFSGGSLTQPARNATLLYHQIRVVYDKMPDADARFMALFLNSDSARSEVPESLLREMVADAGNLPWEDLCTAYTWMYAKNVGHLALERLSESVLESRNAKIREQIRSAELAVQNGDRRYESSLRSLSQDVVMMIVAKARGQK